jgi:ABC-type Mn2+/Zn2+ transport system ATPase subunit
VTTEAWTLRGVNVDLDRQPVLTDVNLEIPQGTVTAIIGASGAGKSTLLQVLANQIQPAVGEVNGELSNGKYPIHGQGWQSRTGAARLAEIKQLIDQSSTALLLDEPTKAIAPDITAAIHDQLLAAADGGLTVALVTHEHRWVERSLVSAVVVTDGSCRNTPVADIDFLAIQHATMERLRSQHDAADE